MERSRAVLRSPVLALVLAVLFWSGNFVVGRALRNDIDPVTLNALRWLIALVLFVPVFGRSLVAHRAVLRREWRLVLGLGLTGIAAFHTLVYAALRSTTVTNALLVLSLAPVAILAGAAATGQERPASRQLIGALVSLAGAVVLITRGEMPGLHGLNPGDLWMLAAVALWAAYSLLLRRRPPDLPQGVALTASIAAALVLLAPCLPLAWATTPAALGSLSMVLSILYVAVFASALAFLLWSYGVAQLGASRAGQFIHLMPLFGAVLAIAFLGEMPTWPQAAGAALVLAGIVLVERRPSASAVNG